MKKLLFILILPCSMASAQVTFTNRPEVVVPLLNEFKQEALKRGVEVKERLASIDSIMLIFQPIAKSGQPSLAGDKADGITYKRGADIWIELKLSKMTERKGSAIRLLYHELGHALGLEDCCLCSYNIMRCQVSDRANFLFEDEDLAKIYLDLFFEAVRNPKKWNEAHVHY